MPAAGFLLGVGLAGHISRIENAEPRMALAGEHRLGRLPKHRAHAYGLIKDEQHIAAVVALECISARGREAVGEVLGRPLEPGRFWAREAAAPFALDSDFFPE